MTDADHAVGPEQHRRDASRPLELLPRGSQLCTMVKEEEGDMRIDGCELLEHGAGEVGRDLLAVGGGEEPPILRPETLTEVMKHGDRRREEKEGEEGRG